MTQALNLFDALALMCVGAILGASIYSLSGVRGGRSVVGVAVLVALTLLAWQAFAYFENTATFWTAAAAIATSLAAGVALVVGLEPRRLASTARRQRARNLAIVISAELETAYLPIAGVLGYLNVFGDRDIVSDIKARWVQYYVTRVRFPTLEKIAHELDVFEDKVAWNLAVLYVDQARVKNAFAPDGEILAVDFGDIQVDDLRLMPAGLFESIKAAWSELHAAYGTKFTKASADSAAEVITEIISASTKAPRMSGFGEAN